MLYHLDYTAFLWLQQHTANPLFDAVLPLWRERFFWLPLYLFVASYLLLNFSRRGALALLFLVAAASVSDVVCSTVIKPLVGRDRPCNVQRADTANAATRAGVATSRRLLVECGGGKSFPSSHAANHFAVAVLAAGILRLRRRWALLLYLWAGSIAFAQVYVGVHYPLDVVAGAALGVTVGWLFRWLYTRLGLGLERQG